VPWFYKRKISVRKVIRVKPAEAGSNMQFREPVRRAALRSFVDGRGKALSGPDCDASC